MILSSGKNNRFTIYFPTFREPMHYLFLKEYSSNGPDTYQLYQLGYNQETETTKLFGEEAI